MSHLNINKFFDNIHTILNDIDVSDEIKSKQRTNVIYLNTDCNLRCEYCYESNSRNGMSDQANCDPTKISEFLWEICEREKDCQSTIVIMGGEPFLQFDLIKYTIAACINLVDRNEHKGWGISLITNGTLFTKKKLKSLKNLIEDGKKRNTYVNLEVSYDGSGQYKRKFPDGSSSKLRADLGIKSLIKKQIPFKISYTVHSGNYDNMLFDCIYILEKFKSEYFKRITIGYAYTELDEKAQIDGRKLKKEFMVIARTIFKIYNIPICDHACELCKQCDKSNFIGNSYLSPTTGITYDKKLSKHVFQQF